MIKALKEPLEVVEGRRAPERPGVLRFCPRDNYAESFGYEWTKYNDTYVDSALGESLSRSRLEFVLGFPAEFLNGMNVLEIGCGAGRFTEHFVRHARNVVAVDLSDAVYSNAALGAPNLLALQADLYDLPPLSEPIDLVFCRGVIQHTPDPVRAIRSLFRYAKPQGLVVFDVYLAPWFKYANFKYFWRPFFQRFLPLEEFDILINRYGVEIYGLHHFLLRLTGLIPMLRRILARTPLMLTMDWNKQYPRLTKKQRLEIFKNDLVDMLYSRFDQPMSPQEVLNALGSAGQIPYSIDLARNIYRCRRKECAGAMRLRLTKNGVFAVPRT